MAPPAPTFAVKEEFVCVHRKWPLDPYKAQVVKIQEHQGNLCYQIHFKNWSVRHDIWVRVGEEQGVMFKGLDEDAVRAILIAQLEGLPPTPKTKAKGKKPATPGTSGAGPSTSASTPKTPAASKAAASKTTPKTPATPKTKAMAKAQSKTVGKSTPKPVTPAAKAKTPVAKTPVAKTPAKPTPKSAAKTPAAKTPAKTPAKPTPKPKTPVAKAATPTARKPPTRRAESEHSEELGESSDSEDEEMEVEEEAPQAQPAEPMVQAPEEPAADDEEVEDEEPPQPEAEDSDIEEVDEPVVEESAEEDEEVEEVFVDLPVRHVDRSDVILHIPEKIAEKMIDDCSVVQMGYLTNLPTKHTIDQIVKIYEREICPEGWNEAEWAELIVDTKENWSENPKLREALPVLTARSFVDYFNGAISAQLYRPEKKQLRELILAKLGAPVPDHRLREAGFRASEFYGITHLFRVISTLPDHILQQSWNEHMINTLVLGMTKFVTWLEQNFDRFYDREAYYVPNRAEELGEEYEASVQEV